MNEHVNGWLTAYFDGELEEHRSQKVQDHLKQCASCREELAALSSLRRLLGDNPEAVDLLPAKRFASQVTLRLTRRSSRPLWRRALTAVWGSIPAVLLATWVFTQALLVLLTASWVAINLGLGGDVLSELALTDRIFPVNPLFLNLGISALLGVMLMSWLASWWIRQQSSAHQITE